MRSAPIQCPVCQVVGPIIDENGCCATCGSELPAAKKALASLVDAFVRREKNDITVEEFDGMFRELLTPGQAMGIDAFRQKALAYARQLPAASEVTARSSEADGWTPLHDPSGDLTVAVGTTCLFAVRTRAGWKHFIDAVTRDTENEPQWRCAEHGWELCNIIYWRPLPEPPKGKP